MALDWLKHNPQNEELLTNPPQPPPGQVTGDAADVRPQGRRAGRPRGARSATSAASKGAIEQATASALMMVNGGVAISARLLHSDALMADRLSPEEIVALTDGLTAEAMTHPRLAKWLLAANGASAHVQLANALIMVAVPRLARHGIIPGDIARQATNSVPVETGGTPFGSGGYGEREIDAAGVPAFTAV